MRHSASVLMLLLLEFVEHLGQLVKPIITHRASMLLPLILAPLVFVHACRQNASQPHKEQPGKTEPLLLKGGHGDRKSSVGMSLKVHADAFLVRENPEARILLSVQLPDYLEGMIAAAPQVTKLDLTIGMWTAHHRGKIREERPEDVQRLLDSLIQHQGRTLLPLGDDEVAQESADRLASSGELEIPGDGDASTQYHVRRFVRRQQMKKTKSFGVILPISERFADVVTIQGTAWGTVKRWGGKAETATTFDVRAMWMRPVADAHARAPSTGRYWNGGLLKLSKN